MERLAEIQFTWYITFLALILVAIGVVIGVLGEVKKTRTRNKVPHTWQCPECGYTVEHSYEALVDVGRPICSSCDREMELIN